MENIQHKKGDEIILEISSIAFEGKGIGRYNNMVVFVSGVVPGDIIKAKITKLKKTYWEASVVAFEKLSEFRVNPKCKYFGVCGGCKWQNILYSQQLKCKQNHVIDAFERIGKFTDVNILPIIGADNIYYYRGKMEYSFADKEWIANPQEMVAENIENKNIFLGLHVPQRYDKVLDVKECFLQSETSNNVLNFIRDYAKENNLDVYNSKTDNGYLRFLVIKESKITKEIMVNLVTRRDEESVMKKLANEIVKKYPQITTVVNTINTKKSQIAFGEMEKIYYGNGYIQEKIGTKCFNVSAGSFFQTNILQAKKLYDIVVEFAELKNTDVVYDLYSGTGSIAIYISEFVKTVIGVESVESAVENAKVNAEKNNAANCTFILGDLQEKLTKDKLWMDNEEKPSIVITDPPRSGMTPKIIKEIIDISPKKIIYVSCNPTTQARDVALFSEEYEIKKMRPVDMFPHTYHIENVCLLSRK